MTRVITATVLSTFLVVGSAAAQTTTPAPAPPPAAAPAAPQAPFPTDARIGFVSMQVVVETSQLGLAGMGRLRTLTDQKAAELGVKNKELQALQQEIQSGQNVLAATVLAQKNADLDRRTREMQFLQEQAQVDVDRLRQELLEDFGDKVLPIVEQLREERNLWVIFSQGDGTGVAAVHPGLDLTAEVIRRLDAAK